MTRCGSCFQRADDFHLCPARNDVAWTPPKPRRAPKPRRRPPKGPKRAGRPEDTPELLLHAKVLVESGRFTWAQAGVVVGWEGRPGTLYMRSLRRWPVDLPARVPHHGRTFPEESPASYH